MTPPAPPPSALPSSACITGRRCARRGLTGIARIASVLGLLGAAPLLPGCSLLASAPQAPMTSYTLVASGPPAAVAPAQVVPSAAASAGLGAQRGQRVLLLAPPQAAPGFDSARMVYQRHAQTFEAFTQSTWVDTPARMLTPLLQERLQASGLFRAVLQAPATSQADLRLETRVLQLQQSFLQQPGSVRFTLLATLSDNQTRTVLAWQRFDVTQATASEDAAGGAAAASLAVQSALDQLTAFVGTRMAALPPLGAAAAKP